MPIETSHGSIATTHDCSNLVRGLLYEIGVQPESLALVGASNEQVESIVTLALATCESPSSPWATIHSIREELVSREQLLCRQLREGRAGSIAEEFAEISTALASLNETRAQGIEQLKEQVGSILTDSQYDQICSIATARFADVPMEYKVVPRTETQWRDLRDSLALQRQGNESSAEISIGNEELVLAARSTREQRRASVSAVWLASFQNP